MAMECANCNFRAELVPAFVTLREFAEADGAPTLFRHIHKQWRGNMNSLTVFKEGRALVLLDGLDEVRDQYFDRVRKAIEEFTDEFHRCSIALTCRIAAREYAFEQFAEVEVADFNELQIQTFATRWFGVQGEQKKAAAFVAKLKANRPILDLASSPLLLTLLCLVFQERNDFEGTRAELYREGLDVLLRKWDAKRGIERDRPYGLSITDLENLLGEIAYRRFLAGEYFFDQADLEKQIEAFFAERSLLGADEELLAERVLNSIESHLGLLVQRAVRVYSFSHLTFQEYLTAQRVAKKTTLLSEIGAHIGDRRWREVWLLLVTMVDADDIIQELKRQIDMLVERESEIQRYLEWCRQKAAMLGDYKSPTLRACCFAFALAFAGDRTLANARDAGHALKLARSRANAIDLDLSLARALDRAFDDTVVRALHLDSSLVRAVGLDRDLDFDHDLDSALAEALDLALFRALAGAVSAATIVAPAIIPELQKLRNEVRLALDQGWWREQWPAWRERLRDTAIRHRNIGHDWRFTSKQMVLLGEYYRSNVFLVECMNAARGLTNKTRQSVADAMLLPWDEIPRG
jgi:predicted NACHT family NTPase